MRLVTQCMITEQSSSPNYTDLINDYYSPSEFVLNKVLL